MQPYSTRDSLCFLITLAQWFLLMPVVNVSRYTLRFKWLSCKSIAAIILGIISFIEVILFFNYLIQQEKKFPPTSGFVFYFTVFVYKILFMNIAQKWPKLMKKWCEVDLCMQNYAIVENSRFKMKLVSIVFFVLALGEHLFFTASQQIFLHGLSFSEELEKYFSMIFQFVFMALPYNFYLAIFVQILNWLWTIIWNYVDVFLISLCISFSFRLKQVENKVALMVKYKVKDASSWREIREHFLKLTELCYELENVISSLVLVSFANKFYVVLYQLLGLFSSEKYAIEFNTEMINKTYYAFSFVYILMRVAAVVYFASIIDLKTRDIASNLFAVSSEVYNTEVERFITSIRVSPPVITGAKLFEIKKSLLLKIASSIIIYELVVIKFHKY